MGEAGDKKICGIEIWIRRWYNKRKDGGSKTQKVRVLDGGEETASMKKARETARKNGLNVRFFAGDNLTINDPNNPGEDMYVRGYILGSQVLVRADHPLYTADQIMRHETGHALIARGQINLDDVRARLEKKVGKENVDKVARLYADAYEGSRLTAEEIWEECVCDSLGDMNIFAEDEVFGDFMSQIMPEIKSEAKKETKAPTQTRGSPEGKASREIRNQKGSKYLTYNFSGFIDVDYTNVYVSDEDLAVIARSVKTGWGRLNPEKTIGGVFTANDYYVFTYNKDHSITIINAFDLNTENDTVDIVKEAINDSRIGENKTKAFSGWLNAVRDGGRFSFADYTNDGGQARETGNTSKLDDRTPEGDTRRDNRASDKNSQTAGKASRELDFIDYINEQADAKKQMSNRELLANALESAVRNDIEAKKLAEYKANIDKMNAQSKKVAELKSEMKELSFSKGQRDKARIGEIRDEIVKTENRIHNYDKKLLGLEATKAISDIIAREKKKAYKKAEQKGKDNKKRFANSDTAFAKRFNMLFNCFSFYKINYKTCGFLNSKGRGVDKQIVISEIAPFIAGVEIVVCRASFVGFFDNIDNLRGFKLWVPLAYSCFAVLQISMNKYTQKAGLVTQNVVGASANIHSASFSCVFPYNLRLKKKQSVIKRHFISKVHCCAKRV